MTPEPTAVLTIQVFPSGMEGLMVIQVRNDGPVTLRPAEKIQVLKEALAMAERELEQDNED